MNNILSVTSGNSELVMLTLPKEVKNREKIVEYLKNIVSSCAQATALTKQMLAYAGKGKLLVESVCIDDIVDEMRSLLCCTVPEYISQLINLQSIHSLIEIDSSQVKQVILNPVNNATEAIGDNAGVIRIATKVRYIEKHELADYKGFDGLEQGEYQVLRVDDTGCGMSDDIIEKIYDPFFYNKIHWSWTWCGFSSRYYSE